MKKLTTVILAAGLGTRMNSRHPKALQKISGHSMLSHVIDAVRGAGSDKIICVLGYGREQIIKTIENQDVEVVIQHEQLGTGHAVKVAKHLFLDGDVLVLFGDTPLIQSQSLNDFINLHRFEESTASFISAIVPDSTGYGRIVRDEDGRPIKIAEEKNASPSEKLINEINSGIGIYDSEKLKEKLDLLSDDNKQGEYLLTDVFEMLVEDGEKVSANIIEDFREVMGVNDKYQLMEAEKIMQERIIKKHLLAGVIIPMPDTVYIEPEVEIGADTVILNGCCLKGETVIGEDSVVGPFSDLINTRIGDGTVIRHSVSENSIFGNECQIGPFAYIRPNTEIDDNVKVGDFVEVKNSKIKHGTKIPHLTYVGDAEIGEKTNIACGSIFVNYDGKNKARTVVGNNCFIGCNVNLIAPLTIGDGVYIAAGTTVTDNLNDGAFAIGRSRQTVKENWQGNKFTQKNEEN